MFVGIDGCSGGWCCCFYMNENSKRDEKSKKNIDFYFEIISNINQIKFKSPKYRRIFIDMPIGLPNSKFKTRKCDRIARAKLTRIRSSSIFPPPCREAINQDNYDNANKINRQITGKGLSKQAWNISNKIKEIDVLLRNNPTLHKKIIESHPELCFWALSNGKPIKEYKKTPIGIKNRMKILDSYIPKSLNVRDIILQTYEKSKKSNLQMDDLIDAAVLAISASLVSDEDIQNQLNSEEIEFDELNFPMRIIHPIKQHGKMEH